MTILAAAKAGPAPETRQSNAWRCLGLGIEEGSRVAECDVPASSTEWKAVSTRGYKYKDSTASVDGVQTIILKSGANKGWNTAKLLVKGKGVRLPDPALPLALPVTVRLVNTNTRVCWESTFEGRRPNFDGDVTKNEVGRFKAKK